ncbi:Glutathione S-transferase U18 [Zostera marina]|uniref:glutathione transferase n=1 Tax=Zostera marina TaxID=29655 RepID=A0A0K9PWE0_ZOSMR|nr:Glutathione S-transferase U18 [Zostera marina]
MEEDLGSKSELLLQSNPIYKKVPVLFHDDRAICDSPIIIEYIDTVWNTPDSPPILPLDPYDRAVAKFWGVFIDDKLYSAFRWTIGGLTEAVRVANVEELHSVLQVLETALGKYGEGKRFFGGDSLGYVDIVLGSALGWIKTAEILTEVKFLDEEKTPLLLTWAERFCAHSAVKGLIPETEKLVQLSPFVKLSWKSKTEASIVAAGDFFWVDKEIGDNAYEASSTDNVLIHKKEVNMVSKLKSLKNDNDNIDMNTMRKKEFKSTHLEDG